MNQRSIYNYTHDDIQHVIEVDHRIWWVGHSVPHDTFQCNTYLIEHGDQSVLIDPGGYLTFEHVYQKVKEVISFSHIRYFICSHQDPDITGVLKTIDTIEDRHKDLYQKLRLTTKSVMDRGKIATSAGVAQCKQNESFLDFIKRADMALYRAKNAGRNKVCSEENTSYEK